MIIRHPLVQEGDFVVVQQDDEYKEHKVMRVYGEYVKIKETKLFGRSIIVSDKHILGVHRDLKNIRGE